jgi:allophanate hydrolase subunit 1
MKTSPIRSPVKSPVKSPTKSPGPSASEIELKRQLESALDELRRHERDRAQVNMDYQSQLNELRKQIQQGAIQNANDFRVMQAETERRNLQVLYEQEKADCKAFKDILEARSQEFVAKEEGNFS